MGSNRTIRRTHSSDTDFIDLVKHLDAELAIHDGPDHPFYSQFNKLENIHHVVVVYFGDIPVSCGALKHYGTFSAEVKRMYTLPEYRGQGAASQVLHELEQWASELGYVACILETSFKLPEAIALYEKFGFRRIPNYGPYAGVEASICYAKALHQ